MDPISNGTAWQLDAVPRRGETAVLLVSGCDPTPEAARLAAVSALLTAVAVDDALAAERLRPIGNRGHYRLTVDQSELMIWPGLTIDGNLDLDSLALAVRPDGPAWAS